MTALQLSVIAAWHSSQRHPSSIMIISARSSFRSMCDNSALPEIIKQNVCSSRGLRIALQFSYDLISLLVVTVPAHNHITTQFASTARLTAIAPSTPMLASFVSSTRTSHPRGRGSMILSSRYATPSIEFCDKSSVSITHDAKTATESAIAFAPTACT